MKTAKTPMGARVGALYAALQGRLPRSRKAMLLFGAALAAALSGAVLLYNLSSGPLHNLNDIGGWRNRLIFTCLSAAVQFALLMMTTAISDRGYLRLALRQLIVTAGYVIALLAINQKTHAYVEQMLPMIREMEAYGLGAIAGMQTSMSAPLLMLLYAVTRGPIYVLYPLKLVCIAAFLVLCLLALYAADRRKLGIRAEVLLSLCVILPQGFMSAACAAQIDVVGAALLGVSLALLFKETPCPWAGTVCMGLSLAFGGAAVYALPVYAWLTLRGTMKPAQLAAGLCIPAALCLPAIVASVPALEALGSLARVAIGTPDYAAGAPNLMNLFPRAAMEEMPEYFVLSRLPNVDPITNFSPYYTETSFVTVMRGMSLAGLACYALVFAHVARRQMSGTARAFALALAAGIASPGATAGAWLMISVIALYAIMTEPRLRVPACVVLFAAMCTAAYPVAGEILLPMVIALLLCLVALFDLMGMFDANRKEV